jgi:hypothetical protein
MTYYKFCIAILFSSAPQLRQPSKYMRPSAKKYSLKNPLYLAMLRNMHLRLKEVRDATSLTICRTQTA